jgi:hypothetical protein
MMLAGKGIIKRGISQVLRESGDGVKVLRLPRAIATIVRQLSRDAMILPSSGISFPSPAIQFGARRSPDHHRLTDRMCAKPLSYSQLQVESPACGKLFQLLLMNGTHPAL